MPLETAQKEEIKNYLIAKIRYKLNNYSPETESKPFHYRLLGKNRMALFSFIHSVNTLLGQSIFEHAGKIMAKPRVKNVIDQYKGLEGHITSEAVLTIDKLLRDIRAANRKPNKLLETEEILSVSNLGEKGKKLKKTVDLYIVTHENIEQYFEIKTAKPNMDVFVSVKKQLLDWIAIRGSVDPSVRINTYVAIPYNPYEPEPYDRWTLQGLFDLENEVLVGKEFWDFIGGSGAYEDILFVFEQAGIELYDEIEAKMKSFTR